MPRAVIASPSDAAIAPARNIDTRDATSSTDSAGPIEPPASRAFALNGPAEFDRCLARPAVIRSGPFALHLFMQTLLADDAASAPCWRLGLVIPKRYEASAVARNTIKRRWRAAFRRQRGAWADEFGSADLVVRMQSPLVKKSDPPMPARVRARDRFDPQDAFAAMVVRLRGNPARRAAASS